MYKLGTAILLGSLLVFSACKTRKKTAKSNTNELKHSVLLVDDSTEYIHVKPNTFFVVQLKQKGINNEFWQYCGTNALIAYEGNKHMVEVDKKKYSGLKTSSDKFSFHSYYATGVDELRFVKLNAAKTDIVEERIVRVVVGRK
ncbi:MAG: hypothetical protein EAZ47_06000 [Bacteroidetes bacterium]|nr:MAG: hypothetical protein EAY72_04505 [Bacteroidota bacterium]TAF93609.1 MAG: hypothetical protein EAZ47_06000 [Bacteroidota bacterium]